MRRGLILAALLATAGAADAGPVGWSYTLTQGSTNGSSYLFLGQGSAYIRGIEPSMNVDYEVQAFLTPDAGTSTGTRVGSTEGYWDERNGSIFAQPLHRPREFSPDTLSPAEYDVRWTAELRITDAESGQSGVAEFVWEVEPRTDFGPELDLTEAWGIRWMGRASPHTASLVLGGNRYEVTGFADDAAGVEAFHVAVTPGTVGETPEPGTLALAALGLAGAALRRRRA